MFRKIAPGFVNQLDTYLLTRYPIIWISKIHYVLWFGLLLYLFSGVIGFLVPVNLTSRADSGLWFFLLSILAFILSWFWGYRYLIFNKEKNFGNLNFTDEYKNFFLVFVCLSVFIWFGSPFVASYNSKVAHMFTDKEITDDINTLNEVEPYVPTNFYSYENTYDTSKKQTFFNVNKVISFNTYTPWRYLNDTINFPQMLSYYKIMLSYKPVYDFNSVKQKIEAHIAICRKYHVAPLFTADEMAKNYILLQKAGWTTTTNMRMGGDYYKEELKIAFNNILEAKFGTLFIYEKEFLWAMFYVTFTLSILLILFKLNQWKQFLILALVMALYPLLIFIVSQIFFSSTSSDVSFQCMIFLLLAVSIISLFFSAANTKVFRPFINVLNQLFFVISIYIPMLVLYFLKQHTGIFYNSIYDYNSETAKSVAIVNQQQVMIYDYRYYVDQYLYAYWQDEYDFWFMIAKFVPIILFIACLPFMKKLFVKQLALPRKT